MGRNQMMIVGVVLVVLGLAALFWKQITYRERETIVDVGPVKVSAETQKEIPIAPILGGVVLAAGVGVLVMGAKRP